MAVFSVQYRPVGDPTLLNPDLHVIREMLIVESGAVLIVNDPAILCITAGQAGRYAKVEANSITIFG